MPEGVDEDAVRLRVRSRELATTIAELLEDEANDAPLMVAVATELVRRLPVQEVPVALPDRPVPIRRLAADLFMPKVYWSGRPVDEVPLDFLSRYCGETEEHLKLLQAYLKHPDLESYRAERFDDVIDVGDDED